MIFAGITTPPVASQPDPLPVVITEEPARQRARTADGRYQADDPATPDLDEAWAADGGDQ